VTDLMAGGGRKTWVTEYAKRPNVFTTGGFGRAQPNSAPPPATGNPGLADAYFTGCGVAAPGFTFQSANGNAPLDASDDASDGAADAIADAPSDATDASRPDASPADDGGLDPDGGAACVGTCCDFDDLNVAMTGLHSTDVVLTRLRADLPVDALKVGDLRLIASLDQGNVENVHAAANPNAAPTATGAGLAPARSSRLGTVVTIGAALFATASLLRRRRRRG